MTLPTTQYRAIKLWHQSTGSHDYYWKEIQRRAVVTSAPQDSIYQAQDGSWVTIRDLAVDHPFRVIYEEDQANDY